LDGARPGEAVDAHQVHRRLLAADAEILAGLEPVYPAPDGSPSAE
jgi:hypothetical protein